MAASSARMLKSAMLGFKTAGALLFGLLMPVVFLSQAYLGMAALGSMIKESSGYPLVAELHRMKPILQSENDYRIASQVLGESANQRAMINKQAMKITAMYVGMATISLGIMIIMLGVKGTVEAGVEGYGMALDFRKVSTGAAVFVVGAAVTSSAALLPNLYYTVPMPAYGFGVPAGQSEPANDQIRTDDCIRFLSHNPQKLQACLKEIEDAKTNR